MKKILLVNPWVHDFAAFDFWLKPLGLLGVGAALGDAGCEVHLLDLVDRNHPWLDTKTQTDKWRRGKFFAEDIPKPYVLEKVQRKFKRYGLPREILEARLGELPDADAVLFTTGMTYWYTGLRETIEVLRKRYPAQPFIAGGIYATLLPRHAETSPGLDKVLQGSMRVLKAELERMLGLKLPDKEHVPLWELYTKLDYAVVRTSTGCPMHCTYCASHLLEPSFVPHDSNEIIEQFEHLERLGIKRAAFYDDALLFHPGFDELIGHIADMDFELHTPNGLHVSMITPARALGMRRAGFRSIYLSLETVDENLLRATGAKLTKDAFTDAARYLKDAGFATDELHAYVLFGLAGQTEESVRRTLELALDSGVKPHITEFSPVPGTREFENSGLTMEGDPLLTNNTAWTSICDRGEALERLKAFIKENSS